MSSTKKKVIISLSSLVAVILIAACAFVAVLAARNASVTSAFNVTYTADKVIATITGSYKVGTSGTDTTITANSGAATSISFDGTEATNGTANVKAFDEVTGVTLDYDNQSVVFTYVITNGSSKAIDVSFKATYGTNSNVTYSYTVDDNATTITAGTATDLGSIASGTTGNTMKIKITISISDTDKDASISGGTFSFGLNTTAA